MLLKFYCSIYVEAGGGGGKGERENKHTHPSQLPYVGSMHTLILKSLRWNMPVLKVKFSLQGLIPVMLKKTGDSRCKGSWPKTSTFYFLQCIFLVRFKEAHSLFSGLCRSIFTHGSTILADAVHAPSSSKNYTPFLGPVSSTALSHCGVRATLACLLMLSPSFL